MVWVIVWTIWTICLLSFKGCFFEWSEVDRCPFKFGNCIFNSPWAKFMCRSFSVSLLRWYIYRFCCSKQCLLVEPSFAGLCHASSLTCANLAPPMSVTAKSQVAIQSLFLVEAMVRGCHIYKDIWTAADGKEVTCWKEGFNAADPFTIAMVKRNCWKQMLFTWLTTGKSQHSGRHFKVMWMT